MAERAASLAVGLGGSVCLSQATADDDPCKAARKLEGEQRETREVRCLSGLLSSFAVSAFCACGRPGSHASEADGKAVWGTIKAEAGQVGAWRMTDARKRLRPTDTGSLSSDFRDSSKVAKSASRCRIWALAEVGVCQYPSF